MQGVIKAIVVSLVLLLAAMVFADTLFPVRFDIELVTATAQEGCVLGCQQDDQEGEGVDCDDPQTGLVVNDPETLPMLSEWLAENHADKIAWAWEFQAGQTNQQGRVSTIGNILSFAQDQIGGDLVGRTVSMHFEWSERAMSRFGSAESSFKDVAFFGIVGEFENSDWAELESISIENLGGFLVIVYASGVDQQDVAKNIMPGWISQRVNACGSNS